MKDMINKKTEMSNIPAWYLEPFEDEETGLWGYIYETKYGG